MPDCDYCEASFDGEDAYLAHLRDSHADELGRVDRRRVGDFDGDSGGVPVGPVVLGVLVVAALVGIVYFSILGGGESASASEPQNVGGSDYHGSFAMTIGGQRVDLSRQRYQVQDRAFHFEGGDGSTWHAHATGVTLEYAIETLGIEVTESSLVHDGTTYNRSEGDVVSFEVNGEPVVPGDYVIERDDRINVTAAG
jgi:hypothetical protein